MGGPPACGVCGAGGRFACSACGSGVYCSKECQKRDWREHKKACRSARRSSKRAVQEGAGDPSLGGRKKKIKARAEAPAPCGGGRPGDLLGGAKRAAFLAKGYCVARAALSPAHVAALRSWADASAPDQRLRHQYNQPGDPHRYEYLLDGAHRSGGGGGVLGEVHRRLVAPLCAELAESDSFVVVSEPGSLRQPWHTDSVPTEGLQGDLWARSLHYIGVLVPLVDFDAQCGRTEVQAGSHLPGGVGEPKKLAMRTGDALVLDGRTLHRGLANRSTSTLRRLCFMTFKLPSVQDGNAAAYGR